MVLLDRFDNWAVRHKRALDVAGFAWLMFGAAVNAGFIPLPELPLLSEPAVFWAGVAVNALWWAALRPRIQRHRAMRAAEVPHNG